MAMSVRLDKATEAWVRRTARHRGLTQSSVIREALRASAAVEQEKANGGSFLDAVADLVGLIRGGPTDLSERSGQRFTRLLRERRGR